MNFIFSNLKKAAIWPLMLVAYIGIGQTIENKVSVHDQIRQQTEYIYDSLVKIRRDFHANPELAGEEIRTSEKITNYLKSLGLEVKTGIGGYGVVGILKGGKEGKKIAWRADMDALASDIPSEEIFKSKNKGMRHICGHDINMTIAIGIANVLSKHKEQLAGTIFFIFQPSEENYKGAKAMIDEGLLDMIDPDQIYASHITPMAAGTVATSPEWLFAGYKTVQISFKNSADTDQVISYTKKLLSNLQNVPADSEFWNPQNLLDPEIGLGNPNTIYQDYITVNKNFKVEKTSSTVSIKSIIGASNKEKLNSIPDFLKQKISQSKYADLLQNVAFSFERPVVYNNAALTAETMKSIASNFGEQAVIPLYGAIPDGLGDDFAYFQEQVPGVYFLLGGSNFEKGIISMPHAPNFAVDESCIQTGVQFFASMLVERL